jgi:Zn-dependent protease with chaperone function
VSRLALLFILFLWMSWSKGLTAADPTSIRPAIALAIFLGGYAVLLFAMRGWAMLVSRRAQHGSPLGLRRFSMAMHGARLLIPAWLGVGIYVLNWGTIVQSIVPILYRWPSAAMHLEFPQAILGTLPAMIAWVGLWWAQYPVDQALREQNVLENLNDDLPVHAPPTFLKTVNANFRLQIAFTLMPVAFILVLRDVATLVLGIIGAKDVQGIENVIMVPATLAVLLFAPELLRRVLHTERLADSPLRRRLEAMCHEAKLGYREILLWRTGGTMGNAAVMGLFGRVRYVLLSDLLLETMTDQQIEAVFAHELGHVVHKHLWWFVLFAIIAMLFMAGPGEQVMAHVQQWYVDVHHHSLDSWDTLSGLVGGVLFFGLFVLAFGYLSPRFERQADVYAARTMQKEATLQPPQSQAAIESPTSDSVPAIVYYDSPTHVGEYGAGVFAAALHRVAIINHMPVTARNWSHGSIAQRMRALHEMSADPAHTTRFDKTMVRLYVGLVLCVCILGMWTAVQSTRVASPVSTGTAAPQR